MDMAMLIAELRVWKENPAMSDDARRKCYLMRNAADEIERLQTIEAAARDHLRAEGLTNSETDFSQWSYGMLTLRDALAK